MHSLVESNPPPSFLVKDAFEQLQYFACDIRHVPTFRHISNSAVVARLVASAFVEFLSKELKLKGPSAFECVLTVTKARVQMINLALCRPTGSAILLRSGGLTNHIFEQLFVFVTIEQDAISIFTITASSTTLLVVMGYRFRH
jgi:hypothetical protein